jgi:hypothetical protein
MENNMAETKPKSEIVDSPFNAPAFTNEQLLKMLIDSQKAQAEANEKLASALIESRKPYVDPKVLEAKQEALKQRQRDIKLELLKRRETKRQCHHHRVDDQEQMQPQMNIKWMRHSNGVILGVCGRCMSQFDATHNPEDANLLRQDPKALTSMGRARS